MNQLPLKMLRFKPKPHQDRLWLDMGNASLLVQVITEVFSICPGNTVFSVSPFIVYLSYNF